jgi:hypothetical protein
LKDFAMPLRDHFRPPLDDWTSWEQFHAQWPAMLVLALQRHLPRQFAAGPRVHNAWAPRTKLTVATELAEQDEYEVRIYDHKRGRRLVAAIKMVSPSNKDRPENRRAFVVKCAALLQQRVSVTIVDLVTTRNFNLYADLLDLLGQSDPQLGSEPPPLYAAACRWTKQGDAGLLETWFQTLTLVQSLPTLPLWLADNLSVPLELEASYEETCRALHIA